MKAVSKFAALSALLVAVSVALVAGRDRFR